MYVGPTVDELDLALCCACRDSINGSYLCPSSSSSSSPSSSASERAKSRLRHRQRLGHFSIWMEYTSAEFALINTPPSRRNASVDELSKSSIGYRPREHANVNVKAWERSTVDRRKASQDGKRRRGRQGKARQGEMGRRRRARQGGARQGSSPSGMRNSGAALESVSRCPFSMGQLQWANKISGSHSQCAAHCIDTHTHAHTHTCVYLCIFSAIGHAVGHKL